MAQDNIICALNSTEYQPLQNSNGSTVQSSVMRLFMFIQKALYTDANQSQRILSTFALPQDDGGVINWYIPKSYGSNFIVEEIQSLPEDTRVTYLMEVCRIIRDLRDRSLKIINDSSSLFSEKNLASFFYDENSSEHVGPALFIPDISNIYIVNDRPIITGWGYKKNSQNWLIEKSNFYRVVSEASEQDFDEVKELFSLVKKPLELTKATEKILKARVAAAKKEEEEAQAKAEENDISPEALVAQQEVVSEDPIAQDSQPIVVTPEINNELHSAEIVNLSAAIDRKRVADKIRETKDTPSPKDLLNAKKQEELNAAKANQTNASENNNATKDSTEKTKSNLDERTSYHQKGRTTSTKNVFNPTVKPEESENSQEDKRTESKRKLRNIVATIVILLATAGFGGAFYFLYGNGSDEHKSEVITAKSDAQKTPKNIVQNTMRSKLTYEPQMTKSVIPFNRLPRLGYDKGNGDGPLRDHFSSLP